MDEAQHQKYLQIHKLLLTVWATVQQYLCILLERSKTTHVPSAQCQPDHSYTLTDLLQTPLKNSLMHFLHERIISTHRNYKVFKRKSTELSWY